MDCDSVILPAFSYNGQPINLGSRMGPLFISSGIPGIDSETGELPESAHDQIVNLFKNIRKGIEVAGGKVGHIVKFTVFARDQEVRDHVNREWLLMFPDPAHRPARNTLIHTFAPQVAAMIEVTAYIPDEE